MTAVRFTFLIDDKPGEGLINEHGLAVYIEAGKQKILFDTGQSSNFVSNAETLGINIGSVDFAVVSHGHYDHGNGLPAFFEANSSAPVYIHSKAKQPLYYSRREDKQPRYIGITQEAFSEHAGRFIPPDSEVERNGNIHILPCSGIKDRGPIFKDESLFLLRDGKVETENFDHEIFMIIEREADYILVSGCSHNNIVSIVKHSQQLLEGKRLKAVIGGFHLPDYKNHTPQHEGAVLQTAIQLSEMRFGPDGHIPMFVTGHCTGDRAKMILKSRLGANIDFFHSGYSILLQ